MLFPLSVHVTLLCAPLCPCSPAALGAGISWQTRRWGIVWPHFLPFASGRKRKDKAKVGGKDVAEQVGVTNCLNPLGAPVRFKKCVNLHTLMSLLFTHTHTHVEVYIDNDCPSCCNFFVTNPTWSPLKSWKRVISTNTNYILHHCSSHKCPILFLLWIEEQLCCHSGSPIASILWIVFQHDLCFHNIAASTSFKSRERRELIPSVCSKPQRNSVSVLYCFPF